MVKNRNIAKALIESMTESVEHAQGKDGSVRFKSPRPLMSG
jgi:hypothetical protein